MRESDARAGGWLAVLDWTCGCGALADQLVPATEEDLLRAVPNSGVPPIVLVPDGWPGS
jgi:hypothetical protein